MRAIIYLNFHIAHFLLFSALTYVGCTIWLNDPVFFIKIKKKPPAKEVVH